MQKLQHIDAKNKAFQNNDIPNSDRVARHRSRSKRNAS